MKSVFKKLLSAILLPILLISTTQTVYAHSFGRLYNLPVPFWLYLYGGVIALIASFLIIGYFVGEKNNKINFPKKNISNVFIFTFLKRSFAMYTLQGSSVFLLFLTILTGIVGVNSSELNFNMTFFWIFFVLGLTYLTAFIGNIYYFLNPWKIMVIWVEKITGKEVSSSINYSSRLGYYPALLFYFIFIWIELFGKTNPFSLSFLLIIYTLVNFMGVILLGKMNWFKYCEFFSVFFNLIGKIAPIQYKNNKIFLQSPFVGLLETKAEHFSLLLFILFMLSSTAFDGFSVTVVWFTNYWGVFANILEPALGEFGYTVFETINLIFSPVIFLIIYFVLIYLAKYLTKTKDSLNSLLLTFAYTLVPIGLVYNISHYYNLLLYQGQEMIKIVSDPFAWGWNIFNTKSYVVNIAFVDAGITWHVQVAMILIGHIASVYLAHIVAIRTFPSHKQAFLSQIPMLMLMVGYTVIGLWILAQPITGGEY